MKSTKYYKTRLAYICLTRFVVVYYIQYCAMCRNVAFVCARGNTALAPFPEAVFMRVVCGRNHGDDDSF